MAVTENTYTGNGSTTNYSFTFPYLEETDIKVSLDGVLTTAYTLANATNVSFTSAPGNGVAIRIYRETNADTPQATFFTGSAIRAQDLNDNFNQVLYNTQETVDRRLDRTGGTMSGNIEFAAGKGIVFEGSTNDANEVTLLGG
ncbi:MAG: phage tail fiber protein, partial [bacterium]